MPNHAEKYFRSSFWPTTVRRAYAAAFAIVLVSCAVSIYAYPRVPDRVASHWNARGEVDGYLPKAVGLFLIPSILFLLVLFLALIPMIDPLKANIEKFRSYYDGFIVLFCLFILTVHLQVVLWNLGVQLDPGMTLPIGIGALFYYTGILLEKAKRNWFIGIRTPWTLSSEEVWNKTHQVGSRMFKAAGAIAVLGAFFGRLSVYFIMIPIFAAATYLAVYSYVEYHKEVKGSGVQDSSIAND